MTELTINQQLVARALDLYANVQFPGYRFIVRESHGGVHLQAEYVEDDVYGGGPQ